MYVTSVTNNDVLIPHIDVSSIEKVENARYSNIYVIKEAVIISCKNLYKNMIYL